MQKANKFLILLLSLLITSANLFAQGPGPAPCGDPDDPGYDPNMCPLDTWVIILIIFAMVVGYYQLYKQNIKLQPTERLKC